MKTKMLFMALALCAVLVSCSKDETDPLVGTWRCEGSGLLRYDEVVLKADKTGTWNFVFSNGEISWWNILSWTATSSSRVMMELRDQYGNQETYTFGYNLNNNELRLDYPSNFGLGSGSYLYIRR